MLHRREKKGLLAGLWEFPNALTEGQSVEADELLTMLREELTRGWPDDIKVTVTKGKKAKHIFSHIEWHMEGICIQAEPVGADAPSREEVEARADVSIKGDLPERLTAFAERLTGKEKAPEDAVFATTSELRVIYAVPSAFEAYVKEILKTEEQEEEI